MCTWSEHANVLQNKIYIMTITYFLKISQSQHANLCHYKTTQRQNPICPNIFIVNNESEIINVRPRIRRISSPRTHMYTHWLTSLWSEFSPRCSEWCNPRSFFLHLASCLLLLKLFIGNVSPKRSMRKGPKRNGCKRLSTRNVIALALTCCLLVLAWVFYHWARGRSLACNAACVYPPARVVQGLPGPRAKLFSLLHFL